MYQPKPRTEGFLEEQDGHRVYYAEYGNPDGAPVISLHGGPGSQSKPRHAKRINLERYRFIVFDQRGCGKSEYKELLKENTTQALVADMERIREHFGIEQWFVTGASWGSSLALLYAEAHPNRVRGLLISSIFLPDEPSARWSFTSSDGAAKLFPDVWQERMRLIDDLGISKNDIATGLYEALESNDEERVRKAAAAFDAWEKNILTSTADVSYSTPDEVTDELVSSARIFLHYESNRFFIRENQILEDIAALGSIPATIVHGRHDIICPFDSAWRLAQGLPQAELVTLPQSNHALSTDGEVARQYVFEAFLARNT